jgi:hypothetical protein
MVAIVTNLDTAMLNPYYFNQFTYDLKSIGDSTYRHLSNGIDVKLSVPDSINWSEYEIIFGSAGVHEDTWQMKYTLSQNYPNPFNPTTTISYTVPQSSLVSLKVYDLMGREVASLVNERKPAGTFFVRVDGSKWASGVYFYRIVAGPFMEIKKLLLMK